METLCEFVKAYNKELRFYSVADLPSVPEGTQYVAIPSSDDKFVIFTLVNLDDLQREAIEVEDLCELISSSDLEKVSFALE